MIEIATLDAESVMSDAVLDEVFEESDPIMRNRLLLSLQERAKILGVKTKFDTMVRAYNKVERQIQREEKEKQRNPQQNDDRMTEFDYFDDGHELYCGTWFANQTGIRSYDFMGEHIACYHPILIAKRLINAETGIEKVRLAFCKGFKWKEITVDKETIASSNKIVSLAKYGVSVTSENARLLVRFLSDLENLNIDKIDSVVSTSKFGWIGDEFMPYDAQIEFDAESRFKDIYESLQSKGSYDEWLKLIRQIRKSGRYEPQLYLAASFASILLKPLNVLPFILNLWGETGKGKTVALMVACSVWANPAENKYITDSSSTQVAVEVREDILNNLPLMMDDLSKVRDRLGDGFADFIYLLCGGKGKDRSNVNLGMNKQNTWQNICLTNIERPLTNDTMRAGAINRILDFEMDDGAIFRNGNHVVSVLTKNYGFAGKKFVNIIKGMDIGQLRALQEGFLKQINDYAQSKGQEKEEKQSIPLSIMLTADKIATDEIFQDGIYLDLERCTDTLKNKGDVSENDRAYEFILSEISININKFVPNDDGEYRGEMWGCIKDGYAVIISSAFDRIAEHGNFSRKGFLQWAIKRELVQTDSRGYPTKQYRFDGITPKCIFLKIPDEYTDEDGFLKVPDDLQEELPFT